MIISKEFYDKSDPTYKKAIDKLERKLADIKNGKDSCNHVFFGKDKFDKFESTILNFSKKYLTPKAYWNFYMRYFGIVCHDQNWCEGSCKIAKRALFHLCYYENWNHLGDQCLKAYGERYLKLLDFQYWHDAAIYEGYDGFINESYLQHPHSYLRECLRHFEKKATSRPSSKIYKQYEKMQTLYAKIKSVEENVGKWFESLLEVDDDEFVMNNVERRLGDNLFDVKLWKLYLTFLEEKKQYKKLLVTLSKYYGFFLDDKEMLEKYHEALIQFVLLEKEFKSADLQNDAKEVGDENDETNEKSNKKIRDNFYDSYCYRLSIGSSEVFENDSLTITPTSNLKLFFKNSIIGGCIILEDFFSKDSVPSTFTSKLISRLSCCTAKFLDIRKQHLSLVELQFLIKHGGVVQLDMSGCEIKDVNGDYVALENIMKHLPNIEELTLPNIRITSKTARVLAKQKFYNKLQLFGIDAIYGEPLDANLFLKFLKAVLDEKRSSCYFCFNRKFDDVAVDKFSQVMKDYVRSKSGISKLSISVSR
uniref:Uncharacterized protein n=1 Tax=Panagrolaimus davidi TaxID=227884 RepID=A0A914PN23_9BILA